MLHCYKCNGGFVTNIALTVCFGRGSTMGFLVLGR